MFLFLTIIIMKVMKELKTSITASLKDNHNERFGVFSSHFLTRCVNMYIHIFNKVRLWQNTIFVLMYFENFTVLLKLLNHVNGSIRIQGKWICYYVSIFLLVGTHVVF